MLYLLYAHMLCMVESRLAVLMIRLRAPFEISGSCDLYEARCDADKRREQAIK